MVELTVLLGLLESSDHKKVIEGLNTLLSLSFESNEFNPMLLTNHPQVLISLGCLLDTINPLGRKTTIDFSLYAEWKEWSPNVPSNGNLPIESLSRSLENNPFLYTILSILRNLSFEAGNEFIISSSAPVMRHLISIILASIEADTFFSVCALAFDILINVGDRFDITGKKRSQNYGAIEDGLLSVNDPFMLHSTSTHFNTSSTKEYIGATSCLLSAIMVLIDGRVTNQRKMTLNALDLLSRISNPDNVAFFHCSPQHLFNTLVSLLTVQKPKQPRVDLNIKPIVGLQSSAMMKDKEKLKNDGVFNNPESWDIEIRDLAINVILSLCSISIPLQLRFAEVPNFVEILYLISDLNVIHSTSSSNLTGLQDGSLVNRNLGEGGIKSHQILSLLLSQPELRKKFQSLRVQLMVSSCHNNSIADLVCNKSQPLYYPPVIAIDPVILPVASIDGIQTTI